MEQGKKNDTRIQPVSLQGSSSDHHVLADRRVGSLSDRVERESLSSPGDMKSRGASSSRHGAADKRVGDARPVDTALPKRLHSRQIGRTCLLLKASSIGVFRHI
ncbi:hypothetical protein RRG08_009982 [Elysia crispata]|uniref:Uncharacterized protein n=1 Tax=Elysia crispata TaxID=231223 RepID=A0AAE1E9K1_9GAST|nr:hypothetical protein RRG08_009982 [Elysia crispata]